MKVIAVIFLGVVALSSAGYVRHRVAPKTIAAPAPAVPEIVPQTHVEIEEKQSVERVPVPQSSYAGHSPARTYGSAAAAAAMEEEYDHEHDHHHEHEHEETDEEYRAREAEDERINQEQAKSAQYSFASAVDDGIMDHSHVRQETRDGLKVTGSYSYSDGFFRRTVTYRADENGYRVISEESEPIGAGPNIDLVNGKADVHTQVGGVDTQYSINADEISVPEPTTTSTTELPPRASPKEETLPVPVRAPIGGLRSNKLSY